MNSSDLFYGGNRKSPIILCTLTLCVYKSINYAPKNIFFVHLVAPYSHPTSYVIEVRLMMPDKKILYPE